MRVIMKKIRLFEITYDRGGNVEEIQSLNYWKEVDDAHEGEMSWVIYPDNCVEDIIYIMEDWDIGRLCIAPYRFDYLADGVNVNQWYDAEMERIALQREVTANSNNKKARFL